MPVSPGRKAGHRVQLTCEHTAEEVCRGPIIPGDTAAAKEVQIKTGRCEREVFGCLFLTTQGIV